MLKKKSEIICIIKEKNGWTCLINYAVYKKKSYLSIIIIIYITFPINFYKF